MGDLLRIPSVAPFPIYFSSRGKVVHVELHE